MSVRRMLGLVAATSVALLVGAVPAYATANYPPGPPSITISATRVVQFGHATVTATGCQPGLAGTVTVTGPGHKVTSSLSVIADTQTVVKTSVNFRLLGSNTVSVTCDHGGTTITQSVKVNVVPAAAIWADHTSVNAGGSVKITATGYGPGSSVKLTATLRGGSQVLSLTLTADASGTVTGTVAFAKAGTYDVRALGVTMSGAALDQSMPITVLGEVLPHTGANFVPFSAGGLALLLVGGLLLTVTRRRRGSEV